MEMCKHGEKLVFFRRFEGVWGDLVWSKMQNARL